MSEPLKDGKLDKVDKLETAETVKENVQKAVKKKGYTNPAFKAMGLPPLRLPSRNWTIFWCVLTGLIGGAVYDNHQHKKIRQKYIDKVAKYGQFKVDPNMNIRKVTVFIAPPPNDYLDESIKTFRKYVKPLLNSAGVDYEIRSENRQGVIRSTVAADIRQLRKEYLENEQKLQKLEEEKKLVNRVKAWFKGKPKDKEGVEAEKKELNAQNLELKNLLGVYYKNSHKEDKVISEDSLVEPELQGGVICIGRGAYKEYIHGIHEGLLGPLEKPEEPEPEPKPEPEVEKLESAETDEKKQEQAEEKKDEEEEEEKPIPIPKPFISKDAYSGAQFAPEFKNQQYLKTSDNVVPVFQQPMLVIPNYYLLGFLNMPERIYRYYTKSRLTEKYGNLTTRLIENHSRPFKESDTDLAKDEEADWPKKWVETGKEKQSEWCSDIVVDSRVIDKLRVYNGDDDN